MHKSKQHHNSTIFPTTSKVILIISLLLFVIFAALNLRTTIWFDEAYSAYLIRGDFSQIWQMTALDVHPPVYYFCLKIWSLIFGTSDFALRAMSVFFGAIAIVLANRLLCRWFGAKSANFATLALAISPIFIRYSQEMRMYALVFVIILSATLLLDTALRNKRWPAWLGYALIVALGMWTHYFTALAWLAHLAYIAYYFRKTSFQPHVFWVYPLAVACFLPWLPTFFNQLHSVQGGFWIPPVNLSTPLSFFSESLTLHDATAASNWLIVPILATLTLAGYLLCKNRPRRSANFVFLALLILLPPLLLIMLSLPPLKPTYVTRYVAYSASLVWALLGLIIAWSRQTNHRLTAGLLAVCCLICAGIGLVQADTRDNDTNPRAITTAIHTHSTPTPVLAHVDPMDYYNLFFYETPDYPCYSADMDVVWSSLEPIRNYQANYLENTADFIRHQDHFWLILPADATDTPDYDLRAFQNTNTFRTEKFVAREFRRD